MKRMTIEASESRQIRQSSFVGAVSARTITIFDARRAVSFLHRHRLLGMISATAPANLSLKRDEI